MSLVRCRECKKEYSNTLKACPHCGFVRPSAVFCATCGNQVLGIEPGEDLSNRKCCLCGYPVLENHGNEKQINRDEQDRLIEEDKSRIASLISEFQVTMESYRDKKLEAWTTDIENAMSDLKSRESSLSAELSKLGTFALGQKKKIKAEIDSIHNQIADETAKLSNLEPARKQMTHIIKQEISSGALYKDTFAARLYGYHKGYIERVKSCNSEYNTQREIDKERLMQTVSQIGKPASVHEVQDMMCKKYPEYGERRGGFFEKLLVDLYEFARLNRSYGSDYSRSQYYYYCNLAVHNRCQLQAASCRNIKRGIIPPPRKS